MLRFAALTLVLMVMMGLLLQCSPASTSQPAENIPPAKIQLMTSLPIIWGEGGSMEDILSGKATPAAIYAHWQKRYDMTAVDSFEGLANSDTDIVLLAQPPAMDPADIATIDSWVRAGGKAIILTDPMLVWPTSLPLGDKRRPLASGLLSPLLNYWGLALQLPPKEETGVAEMAFPNAKIITVGIGTFESIAPDKSSHADCAFSVANVIARCKVGDGHAILLADADFLNDALWGDQAGVDHGDARGLVDNFIADMQKQPVCRSFCR